jgi:hypothetical protein
MKVNIFVVTLLAMVKTLAVTAAVFLLMILVFHDTLDIWHRDEDIFLYIFFGLFFYSLGCIVHFFAILLPIYAIDRQKVECLSAHELFSRHAPVVAGLTTLMCGLVALIAGMRGLEEGMMQCNFFTVYVMSLTGLLFYEYQIKQAVEKAIRKAMPPPVV